MNILIQLVLLCELNILLAILIMYVKGLETWSASTGLQELNFKFPGILQAGY